MANEKRLIDANVVMHKINAFAASVVYRGSDLMFTGKDSCNPHEYTRGYEQGVLDAQKLLGGQPTVDAVEVVRIEEVKKEILQGFDVLIAEYQRISQSSKDYFGIKADAMEIARRLVNAALTDLCTNCGAKMDGGNEDV